MTGLLLEIDDVVATRDGATLLAGVSLGVPAGQVVALLGGNGAGKSSLLAAIMGLLALERGTIRLDGRPLAGVSVEARARRGIGWCPEGRRLFPGMTVADTLAVASRATARRREARRSEVLDLFPDLAERLDTPAWQLSGGQQQMLAIGRALMGEPRLLLLDEPSRGLAPVVLDQLFPTIRQIAGSGVAVLLAEQSPNRALAVADLAVAMAAGRVVTVGEAARVAGDPALAEALLGA